MKRNMKKLLAGILVLAMVLSVIPAIASAEEAAEITHHPEFAEPYVEASGNPTGYQWYMVDAGRETIEIVVNEEPQEGKVTVLSTGATVAGNEFSIAEGVMGLYMSIPGDTRVDLGIFADSYQAYVASDYVDSFSDKDGIFLYNHSGMTAYADVTIRKNDETGFSLTPTASVPCDLKLDGCTDAAYPLTEPVSNEVYCVVSYADGTTLESYPMFLGYQTLSYPTVKKPTVEMSWEDRITGYQ